MISFYAVTKLYKTVIGINDVSLQLDGELRFAGAQWFGQNDSDQFVDGAVETDDRDAHRVRAGSVER